MPKIRWDALPPSVWQHLRKRAEERQITLADLMRLDAWKQFDPDVPAGEWYKDFGSFKLCGEGVYPKTFLTQGQAARGKKIE